jgi:ABC-type cobalamin/Fe3+-siderophores transport system ATPase subunit
VTGPLSVDRLSLATREGPVFTDVSFVLEPGRLGVLVGASGQGRSALLLAVTGRMRGTTGAVRLGRHGAATRPKDLRAVTSVARLATLVEPEGQLSVAESITERALLDGVRVAEATAAVARAEGVLGLRFGRERLVDDLGAYERSLLCVALALVRPAELVVLDDADRSLDLYDQERLLAALVRLCDTGPTVLAATTEAVAVPPGAVVIPLERPGDDAADSSPADSTPTDEK